MEVLGTALMFEVISTKKIHYRISVHGFYLGAWLHRHHLPSTRHYSRFSEGKQVFNINHIVQALEARRVTFIRVLASFI